MIYHKACDVLELSFAVCLSTWSCGVLVSAHLLCLLGNPELRRTSLILEPCPFLLCVTCCHMCYSLLGGIKLWVYRAACPNLLFPNLNLRLLPLQSFGGDGPDFPWTRSVLLEIRCHILVGLHCFCSIWSILGIFKSISIFFVLLSSCIVDIVIGLKKEASGYIYVFIVLFISDSASTSI